MNTTQSFFQKNEIKIARISTIVIFLALIRSLLEFFRLDYLQQATLTIDQVKPFIIGSLVAAIGCLLITIFSFYAKNRLVIIVSALTIVAMIIVKYIYKIA